MAVLLGIERLFADGCHNAFTDLAFWNGRYYLGFRKGQTHLGPAGDVLIYRTEDLKTWELCARLDTGGDDRDPKFIDAGRRLGVVFGTWVPRWGDGTRSLPSAPRAAPPRDLISHVCVSGNGTSWTPPRQVYGTNYWLWRILPTSDGFYSAAYHFGRPDEVLMTTLNLLHSENLFEWRLVCVMRVGGGVSEAALYQPEPGRMCCIARTDAPDFHSWIGRSEAPYTEWSWADLGVMIKAPAVLKAGDRWIAAGRSQRQDLPEDSRPDESAFGPDDRRKQGHTSVWEIKGSAAGHVLTVPSDGDCSYPGLALGPEGEVLMSYYSQHAWRPLPSEPPTPADICLARFRL